MWKSWKQQAVHGDKTDYDTYAFSGKELAVCLIKSVALTAAFAYMFYQSWIGMAALPAVAYFGIRREHKRKLAERKERLALQFQDAVLAVSAGMQAGRSAENAFLEAEGEIGTLYGKSSEMAKELALVRKGLKNQIPLEQMLLSLGERSHVEEIRDFSEVFAVAKRLGGNLKEVIRRTAELTRQRMETEREIATLLAAKKYEQRVMMLIPFLLFGYLQLTSRGFFDILYHNAAGIAVMTICLVIYLAAWVLAERLMDIRI